MKRRRQQVARSELKKCESVLPSVEQRPSFQLFPGYSLHVVLFIVLVGRLSYVTDHASWWTLHPDEIFQVVEVAHGDVYGFGFESSGHQRPLQSVGMEESARESMRATYSWIIPRFYSWALVFKEAVGIPTSPYLFTRQVHTVVSGLLPLFVFLLCRRLHPDWPTDVATIASLVVGFGDYFILQGTHTFLQSLLSPALFYATYLLYRRHPKPVSLDKNDNYAILPEVFSNPDSVLTLAIVGSIHGLVCYVKPDSFIFVITLHFVLLFETGIKSVMGLFLYCTSFFCIFSLAGYQDFIHYDEWYLSIRRWLDFEINHAGNVFGHNDHLFYFKNLILVPGMHAIMLIASTIVGILYVALTVGIIPNYRELRLWSLENKDSVIVSLKLALCSIVILVIQSFQPHKDMRYIHDALVLLSCSGAASLFCLYQLCRVLSEVQNQDKIVFALKLFIYAEAVLYAIRACSPIAMNTRFKSMPDLVIPGSTDSWRVNSCLNYVSRQQDVTGLLLDHPLHLSFGYTGLHFDVPLIAKTHFDFRIWNMTGRHNFTSQISIKSRQSLANFERISDYIAEENGKLVLALLAQPGSPFNYAILTRNRRFPKQGFREVFRSGNVTVAKRIRSRTASEYLEGLVKQIPLGTDVSVLQVEASWLLAFKLPLKARERLEYALKLDSNNPVTFQLLHMALFELEMDEEAILIAKKCLENLSEKICGTKFRINPLHPGYSFGISRLRQPRPIMS